jgi:hypothetical protein
VARRYGPPQINPGPERVPDIFDEVNEDLRADQARKLLRRYGGLLVLAMLATLAGVGAYDWYEQKQTASADSVALKFLAAQKQALSKTPPKDLVHDFAGLAETAPSGYRILARLHLAAAEWNQGQHDSAVANWQGVTDDTAAPQILRDLATLTSVQHQVDTGDAQVLKAKLLPIVQGKSRWRPLAEQVTALLDIRLGRVPEAKQIMKSLTADPQAPTGVRQMAQDLLITLGEDGAGPHG